MGPRWLLQAFAAPSDPLVASTIAETRRQGERFIALAAVCVGLASIPPVLWRMSRVDAGGGRWILLFILVLIGYYLVVYRRYRQRIPTAAVTWAHTALEVTIPTVIQSINARHSPLFALTDTTAYLYLLVIVASSVRLRPALPLFAGLLAALEIGLTHAFIGHLPGFSIPSLGLVFAAQRAVFLLAGAAVSFVIAATALHLVEGVVTKTRDHERVRQVFGAYVATPVMERILKGDLTPVTERREVSVLFVDVRGFTGISEATPPSTLLPRLNGALEAFSRAVADAGGIVNKYLGDGLMAIFGAPEAQADHPRRAARAALAMARAAADLDETGAFPGLRIGVGVHTGEAVVGDVGGEARREYTAIGDTVNVAARVEAENKALGTTILVTASVARRLGEGFDLGPAAAVQLRGRDAEVEVHALLGAADDATGDPNVGLETG